MLLSSSSLLKLFKLELENKSKYEATQVTISKNSRVRGSWIRKSSLQNAIDGLINKNYLLMILLMCCVCIDINITKLRFNGIMGKMTHTEYLDQGTLINHRQSNSVYLTWSIAASFRRIHEGSTGNLYSIFLDLYFRSVLALIMSMHGIGCRNGSTNLIYSLNYYLFIFAFFWDITISGAEMIRVMASCFLHLALDHNCLSEHTLLRSLAEQNLPGD